MGAGNIPSHFAAERLQVKISKIISWPLLRPSVKFPPMKHQQNSASPCDLDGLVTGFPNPQVQPIQDSRASSVSKYFKVFGALLRQAVTARALQNRIAFNPHKTPVYRRLSIFIGFRFHSGSSRVTDLQTYGENTQFCTKLHNITQLLFSYVQCLNFTARMIYRATIHENRRSCSPPLLYTQTEESSLRILNCGLYLLRERGRWRMIQRIQKFIKSWPS
jgi:hypothetical protein